MTIRLRSLIAASSMGQSLHTHRECDLRDQRLVARISFGYFEPEARTAVGGGKTANIELPRVPFGFMLYWRHQCGRGGDAVAQILTLSYEQLPPETGSRQ
jgi:hypothetical protein